MCFRAGCITGPQHAGTELHGFLSFLIKNCIKNKKYKIFGYGGNQVRDNIHSKDLVNCFWEYMKKPTAGEVYNIGGGIKNSISINEALKFLESKLNIIIKNFFFINLLDLEIMHGMSLITKNFKKHIQLGNQNIIYKKF